MKRIWVDSQKCLSCKTCELQCAVERNSITKTLAGAVQEMPRPVARVGVHGSNGAGFPLQCRHCTDAACLKACPAGAMQRDDQTGITFIDQTKCRSCWMCIMSCPFGAVTMLPEYKVAHKCDACMHMEQPACVAACPTQALVYGDENEYAKVRVKRSNLLAIQLRNAAGAGIVGLDYVREDD